MFDDAVEQKNIPLPTTVSQVIPPIPVNITITFDGVRAWVTWDGKLNTTYQLATDTTGFAASFLSNGPSNNANFAVLDGMTTVYLRAVRHEFASVWVAIPIPGVGTVVVGRPAPYNLTFYATSATTATATWIRAATDNTDVDYSFDNGTTKTPLGSATVVTKNFTGLTAGATYSLVMFNEWATGTTYSGPSETRTITMPVTGSSANDPVDLVLIASYIAGDGTCALTFHWNPQSGTNPTFHFTDITDFTYSFDYNPTSTPITMHISGLPQGHDWSAYVDNADGANPSETIYGRTAEEI
jgi:hypothetical protein